MCVYRSESSGTTPEAVGTNAKEPDCVVPIRTLATAPPAQPQSLQATPAQDAWQVVGPPAKTTSPPLPVVSAKPAPAANKFPVRRPSPPKQKQLDHKALRVAAVQERFKQAQAKDAAKQQQQQQLKHDR